MGSTRSLKSRVVCGFLVAGMVCGTSFPTSAAVSLSGDSNTDGALNATDYQTAMRAILGTQSLSYQGFENANLCSDSYFDVIDACVLKRSLASAAVTPSEAGIYLENTYIEVVGSGVTLTDTTVATITEPGTYNVYGTLNDGQIIVDVDKTTYVDGEVELILNGITLSCSDNSPIYVASVDGECKITAKKGTVSTISDGTSYTNADGDAGAVYCCDDVKFKGEGTLNVYGNCLDAIVCKNDIKIWNGTINVTGADDAIRGKDSVRIGDPDDTDYSKLNLTVKSTAGDGIKSTNAEDADSGFVRINGGIIDIDSYADGISGEQFVEINGGTIDIYTYQGSSFTGTASGGGWGGMQEGNSNKVDISAKGIKAVGLYDTDGTTYLSAGNLTITGGNITIDSSDDALHCAGAMSVTGGTLSLASADDGMHSDSTLTIGTSGSTDYASPIIDVTKSYEAVEGMNIVVNGGSVLTNSTDDGFNAAGGTDGSGSTNPGGWGGGGSSASGNYSFIVNGGYIYTAAGGDGLDSNGSFTVNGGYVFVSQTGGGNSPIDCDSTWSYNGGVVIAGGSSDMFSESIPNNYQFVKSSGAGISAGDVVTLATSSGQVLGTMTFKNAAAAIVMCAPQTGSAYKGGSVSGATYFTSSSVSPSVTAGYGGTISGGTALSSSGGGGTNPWG